MSRPLHRSGFTLIELSIVLVIIGLIVGGVMVGKELVAAANARSFIKQKDRLNIAFNTFKMKYNCVPGDCANLSALGLPGTAGNGDGFIWTGTSDLTNFNNDQQKFLWKQLQAAGLLTDKIEDTTNLWYGSGPTAPGYHSPTCTMCKRVSYNYGGSAVSAGGWDVMDGNGVSTLTCGWLGYYETYGTIPTGRLLVLRSTSNNVIRPADAYSVDVKIDDGRPLTGQIIAVDNFMISNPACSGLNINAAFNFPNASCVNRVTNRYITTYEDYCFNVAIKAGF